MRFLDTQHTPPPPPPPLACSCSCARARTLSLSLSSSCLPLNDEERDVEDGSTRLEPPKPQKDTIKQGKTISTPLVHTYGMGGESRRGGNRTTTPFDSTKAEREARGIYEKKVCNRSPPLPRPDWLPVCLPACQHTHTHTRYGMGGMRCCVSTYPKFKDWLVRRFRRRRRGRPLRWLGRSRSGAPTSGWPLRRPGNARDKFGGHSAGGGGGCERQFEGTEEGLGIAVKKRKTRTGMG